MSEWLCVEAIVRQKDREATAASIARLSESSGKPKPEPEPCEVSYYSSSTPLSLHIQYHILNFYLPPGFPALGIHLKVGDDSSPTKFMDVFSYGIPSQSYYSYSDFFFSIRVCIYYCRNFCMYIYVFD